MNLRAADLFRIAESYKPTRGKDVGLGGTIASGRFASLASQVAGAIKGGDSKALDGLNRRQLTSLAKTHGVESRGKPDRVLRTELHDRISKSGAAPAAKKAAPGLAARQKVAKFRDREVGTLGAGERARVDRLSDADQETYWTRRAGGMDHTAAIDGLKAPAGPLRPAKKAAAKAAPAQRVRNRPNTADDVRDLVVGMRGSSNDAVDANLDSALGHLDAARIRQLRDEIASGSDLYDRSVAKALDRMLVRLAARGSAD